MNSAVHLVRHTESNIDGLRMDVMSTSALINPSIRLIRECPGL